ncbi:MAG: hypothetical protein ACPGWR_17465 [Ardenticatenaceae bacterium]
MDTMTLTFSIPERLYHRLQTVAHKTKRTLPEVLVASAETALAHTDTSLPPKIANELASMPYLSREELWAATDPTLSATQLNRLDTLSAQQKKRTLSTSEQQELKALLAEYDRSVLRRAQAFALLQLRGNAIPDLNRSD